MTKLKLILMAILAIFARLFALPTSAAQRGFSIMRSPLPKCQWLAVCLLGATLAITGCSEKPYSEILVENCGSLRSADTCQKAKNYLRCAADTAIANPIYIHRHEPYYHAQRIVKIECGDEDAEKGKPFQQVCPEGAACNQGVQ